MDLVCGVWSRSRARRMELALRHEAKELPSGAVLLLPLKSDARQGRGGTRLAYSGPCTLTMTHVRHSPCHLVRVACFCRPPSGEFSGPLTPIWEHMITSLSICDSGEAWHGMESSASNWFPLPISLEMRPGLRCVISQWDLM